MTFGIKVVSGVTCSSSLTSCSKMFSSTTLSLSELSLYYFPEPFSHPHNLTPNFYLKQQLVFQFFPSSMWLIQESHFLCQTNCMHLGFSTMKVQTGCPSANPIQIPAVPWSDNLLYDYYHDGSLYTFYKNFAIQLEYFISPSPKFIKMSFKICSLLSTYFPVAWQCLLPQPIVYFVKRL